MAGILQKTFSNAVVVALKYKLPLVSLDVRFNIQSLNDATCCIHVLPVSSVLMMP